MNLARLKPYVEGLPGLNWGQLELNANESFKLNTHWNLSGVPNSSARGDGDSLRLTDSKVIRPYKSKQHSSRQHQGTQAGAYGQYCRPSELSCLSIASIYFEFLNLIDGLLKSKCLVEYCLFSECLFRQCHFDATCMMSDDW